MTAAAVLAPAAWAGAWDGFWIYNPANAPGGCMKLDQSSGSVKGRYEDLNGKKGKISGSLSQGQTVWKGNYHNTTDKDKGTFKFILEDGNFWEGKAKSKFADGKFGVQGTAVSKGRCKDKVN